jgi:hypothetical protein
MKTKSLVFVTILILFVAPVLLADDYKKEIPVEEAMKAYCATWFVETGLIQHKLVNNNDGTWGLYYKNAETPNYSGTFKIEKAWKDGEGNTWLIVWKFRTGNSWHLNKISEDGNVWEKVIRYIRDNLPAEIDPSDGSYARFILKKKE